MDPNHRHSAATTLPDESTLPDVLPHSYEEQIQLALACSQQDISCPSPASTVGVGFRGIHRSSTISREDWGCRRRPGEGGNTSGSLRDKAATIPRIGRDADANRGGIHGGSSFQAAARAPGRRDRVPDNSNLAREVRTRGDGGILCGAPADFRVEFMAADGQWREYWEDARSAIGEALQRGGGEAVFMDGTHTCILDLTTKIFRVIETGRTGPVRWTAPAAPPPPPPPAVSEAAAPAAAAADAPAAADLDTVRRELMEYERDAGWLLASVESESHAHGGGPLS